MADGLDPTFSDVGGGTVASPDLLAQYSAGVTGIFNDPNITAIGPGQVTDPSNVWLFAGAGSDPASADKPVNPTSGQTDTVPVSGNMIDWSRIQAAAGTSITNIGVRSFGALSDFVLGRAATSADPQQKPQRFGGIFGVGGILGPTVAQQQKVNLATAFNQFLPLAIIAVLIFVAVKFFRRV